MADDTPDISTVLADDNFKSLGLSDKNAVLMKIDPNYAGLAPKERASALDRIHYGPPAPQPPGFWSTLGSDIAGTVKGVVRGLAEPLADLGSMGESEDRARFGGETLPEATGVTHYKKQKEAGYSLPYRLAAPIAETAGANVEGMEQSAREGDPGGVLGHAAAGAAVAAAPLVTEGLGKGAKAFDERVLMPRRVISGKEGLLDSLKVPGGKAGQRLTKYEGEVETAAPHLAEIERTTPIKEKGAEAYAETAANIRNYRDEFWDKAHVDPVERHAQMPFDASSVITQSKGAISNVDRDVNAVGAARADNWIKSAFSRPKTLAEADRMVRILNDELRNSDPSVYGPVEKRVMNKAVEGLRDQIDVQLQAAGETGIKQSNKEWGALRAVEDRLRERYAQEAPKAARSGPIPDWVHEYMLWHGGMPTVGVGLRIGKMMIPTEGGRLTSAMRDLANTSLAPTPITTPAYVGKRPIGSLPAAGGSSYGRPNPRATAGVRDPTLGTKPWGEPKGPGPLEMPVVPSTTALARVPGSSPRSIVGPGPEPLVSAPGSAPRVSNPTYMLPEQGGGGRVLRSETKTAPPSGSPTGKFERPGGTMATSSVPRFETDSSGIHWAVAPDGVRVSIPQSMVSSASKADLFTYAQQALDEQRAMRSKLPKPPKAK